MGFMLNGVGGRGGASHAPGGLAGRMDLAAAVIQNTCEAVMITDALGQVVWVNPAFSTITGYTAAEVGGRNPRFLSSGRHDAGFYREMWACLLRTGHWQGEIWNRRRNGELFPAWQTISSVRDAAGDVVNHVSLFSDIGALKRAEEQLRHMAHHDMLTGLPNRVLFAADLVHSLQRAERQGQRIALLFVDLDCFKLVNDTLGHAVGDRTLRIVGARLRAAVRAEDRVARLGGDEFTVVLEEVGGAPAVAAAANKLLAAVAQPMELEGRSVCISASIGIAVFPVDGTDADTLVRAADAAMYRAKRQGGRACTEIENSAHNLLFSVYVVKN